MSSEEAPPPRLARPGFRGWWMGRSELGVKEVKRCEPRTYRRPLDVGITMISSCPGSSWNDSLRDLPVQIITS